MNVIAYSRAKAKTPLEFKLQFSNIKLHEQISRHAFTEKLQDSHVLEV